MTSTSLEQQYTVLKVLTQDFYVHFEDVEDKVSTNEEPGRPVLLTAAALHRLTVPRVAGEGVPSTLALFP